jgi:hypothetical protein
VVEVEVLELRVLHGYLDILDLLVELDYLIVLLVQQLIMQVEVEVEMVAQALLEQGG